MSGLGADHSKAEPVSTVGTSDKVQLEDMLLSPMVQGMNEITLE